MHSLNKSAFDVTGRAIQPGDKVRYIVNTTGMGRFENFEATAYIDSNSGRLITDSPFGNQAIRVIETIPSSNMRIVNND